MHDNPGVTGVVLAGGGSRRMGRDKALLEWQGRTLLDHVRARVWAAGCDAVVTSRAAPGCIADHYPDCGPLGGIHAVLRSRLATGYLVVPVDMPLLSIALLRGLIDCGRDHGHCYYRRSFLPCYLSGDPVLPDRLAQRLRRGDLALGGFLRELHARALDGVDDAAFLNTNTPEAWCRATALGARNGITCKETGS